jgi:hypothetical protein
LREKVADGEAGGRMRGARGALSDDEDAAATPHPDPLPQGERGQRRRV